MSNDKTVTMSRELALLKEASEWIKANSFGGTDAIDLWERIDAQLESVNGVRTDEYLIEIAKQSAAVCSEQHSYMDRALYLDWQPHKWVIDAMRKVAAPVVERQDGSALMKIAADLANRHPLRQLYLACEHQGRINTDSLHEHLDKCGDLLAGIALDIRRAITSPPAPVAAQLDDSVEFEKWWCRTPILRKGRLQIAQEAWEARAGLGKVKELNQ